MRLSFSDPATPEVFLRFAASVGIGPEPVPRSLSFGRICRGQSDTLTFAIKPTPGSTLQVLDACSDTACVVVEDIGEDVKGMHRFRVIATNREGCGRLASLVSVSTSDTLREVIRVPITVSLIGHIIVEPDIVAFGPTLAGAYVKQSVRISAVQGEEFSIPEVVSMIDEIETVVTPIDETSCQLRLKVTEKAAPGRVTGEIILIQDADLEYDPKDYDLLLLPILDGRAEVVYGSRFLGGPHRVLFFWHYFGNKFLTLLSNLLNNLNLTDMEVGYKVFQRHILDQIHLKSNRFGFEPEFTAKIARLRPRIYEVPISYSGRSYEEGKKITWKDGIVALVCIVRFRFFK